MIVYKTKASKISGTDFKEITKKVRKIFNKSIKNSKRKPFIRSAYFKGEKIFFDYFWDHLKQKNPRIKYERLRFFEAAVELVKNSRLSPEVEERSEKNEILYRFEGLIEKSGEIFYVQIKENKKSGDKYFMSCFPNNK